MTGILKVDQIQNSTGGFVIPPPGGIIQTQYTQYTGTTTQALTAYAYTPIDVLSVDITPASASSTIKLDAGMFIEFGNYYSETNHIVYFYRDSTQLGQPSAGSRYVGVGMIPITYYGGNDNDSTPNYGTFTFFDTPNTTDTITYKVGMLVKDTQTISINKTVSDSNALGYERGTSFISATEIAG